MDGSLAGFDNLEQLLEEYVPEDKMGEVKRVLYGLNQGKPVQALPLGADLLEAATAAGYDLQAYQFHAAEEQLRPPRIVRVALVQNSIKLPTTAPFAEQREAILARVRELIEAAGASGVNILSLPEFFDIPFFFCTNEKRWAEFAEPISRSTSIRLCQELAQRHNMVLVCPILERDEAHAGTMWNTAVVVSNSGRIIGKHRKNHVTRLSGFNESAYYMEGNTGHPVFETAFGKIAVNICYGRHHPMNWQGFALNGAEIVFNPCATIGELSEPLWPIEARNAAIAYNFYVGAINRVGTEVFPGNGRTAQTELGPFYGSSYFAAPDASRTPSLARNKDGLIIADLDLNLCQQVRDHWGFQMTARYEMYAKQLNDFIGLDYKQQVIRDPSL